MIAPRTKAADAALNMTPMIDIVFQLILFFLFNLRFKSLDWRIETHLPPAGIRPDIQPPLLVDHLKATVVRLDADQARARTKVKIGGSEWVLPPQGDADRVARDAVLASIRTRIERLRRPEVVGEIDTPRPTGALVPHGDVVSVLDQFLAAGVNDVHFQGAPWPSPRR